MKQRVKPTPEQVALEIARLNEVHPRVPTHSYFGEDNRAAIDAQIRVLQESMSLDEVHDTFGELTDEGDFSQNTLDCALTAHDWLHGDLADEEASPAFGWEGIAR
ncbi:hypothetical protein [Acidovorax sp. LjRoot117]|uniref:hypothetical protein n=1 Tax=Acidovorax sp. LjRoot117 TaxID=3342255 RepID=UPI003ECF8F05